MNDATANANQIELAADIVSAFVSNNAVPASELPGLIQTVHECLKRIVEGAKAEPAVEAKPPAVPIKRSVTENFVVCLECGKKFKSLKRHLHAEHGLSPDEYRSKWALNRDYPMVAPAYATARSALAKQMGLGQKRTRPEASAAPAPPAASAKRGRGRAKSAA
jgi:predicted transcriptional regulator